MRRDVICEIEAEITALRQMLSEEAESELQATREFLVRAKIDRLETEKKWRLSHLTSSLGRTPAST